MRIGIVADVHVGNHRRFGGPLEAGLNRRCQQTVAALRLACSAAEDAECDVLVVCGDLFDSARPEPQVVRATMDALGSGPEIVYVLKGNHDSTSGAPGDHALGPVEGYGGNDQVTVVVHDSPSSYHLRRDGSEVDLVFVPFLSGPASEWLPGALDEALGKMPAEKHGDCRKLLFLHLGIEGQDTPVFLRGAADSIGADRLAGLMRERGIRAAFAGNWHDPRQWSFDKRGRDARDRVDIFQAGALCPTGFDNPGGDYGRLVVWDSELEQAEQLGVPGPRFVKILAAASAPEIEVVEGLIVDGCAVHVSVRCRGQDDLPRAHEVLDRLLAKGAVDGEVSLDPAEAEVAARSAASAVRSAETLEEALAVYVREMQLPDGVPRDEVLARARRYLTAKR